jgi:Rps23 Pro-64 3,4-dihydroxylase Tpa1-like proline 4-hydroxylase
LQTENIAHLFDEKQEVIMAVLEVNSRGGYLSLDYESAQSAGATLSQRYQSATPFPHIVMDDFVDIELLRKMVQDFPSSVSAHSFDRVQEKLKFQYAPWSIDSSLIRSFLDMMNSRSMIGFLEAMTGINGLIPDPHFSGGGLHEIKPGGLLGVHADFNVHETMQLERRLNLLIYLNDDWSAEFGGDLELWNEDMTACERKISPIMGRAVVFNTTLSSYHGHPEPLRCPHDRTRRSIALYYYTSMNEPSLLARTTTFQVRPGSTDRVDWRVKARHLALDWLPPKISRQAFRTLSKLRGN